MLSIWEKETFYTPVDVLIAGGGLLGWWTAYEIKKHHPQCRVLVLEKQALPLGASTRNAGFACFGSPSELWADVHAMGADECLRLVEMRYKGILKIRQVLGDGAVDYDDCGGYECYDDDHGIAPEALDQLNQLLAPVIGVPQVFTLDQPGLKANGLQGFSSMVANAMEGGLHSGRLLAALRKLAQGLGVGYRSGQGVVHWQATTQAIAVNTGQGSIYARRLVLATNAYLHTHCPALGIVPARGQMLLTRPLPGLMLTGTFHYNEGYYYWRNLGNRILLGGARNTAIEAEQTLQIDTSQTVQQALEHFLQLHLPQYFTPANTSQQVEMRWSGLMAMTPGKQPVLSETDPGVWAAMCCNGMGVALSPVFAELVAAAATQGL
ncbi:MAG TPA: FAD-binding oxidoreductase [Phnomibacter sp.]|nr:FAD-binding oxidoreductase [Phnomibacter sp.]